MVDLPIVIPCSSDGSAESLIQAREHMAFCGLSLGSMTCYDSIQRDFFPYFAYYANLSCAAVDLDALVASYNSEANKPYGLSYLFTGCGIKDRDIRNEMKEDYLSATANLTTQSGEFDHP